MSKRSFIASSREALPYARGLQARLNERFRTYSLDIECMLWTDRDATQPNRSHLENLIALTRDVSYAVALFSPDDAITIRGQDLQIPRDNVIFEFGLLIGALGRGKTFALVPGDGPYARDRSLRLPTDLDGINNISYSYDKDLLKDLSGASMLEEAAAKIDSALFQACDEIAARIARSMRSPVPTPPDRDWDPMVFSWPM